MPAISSSGVACCIYTQGSGHCNVKAGRTVAASVRAGDEHVGGQEGPRQHAELLLLALPVLDLHHHIRICGQTPWETPSTVAVLRWSCCSDQTSGCWSPAGVPMRCSRTCRDGRNRRAQAQLMVQADDGAGPVEGPRRRVRLQGRRRRAVGSIPAATGRRQVRLAPNTRRHTQSAPKAGRPTRTLCKELRQPDRPCSTTGCRMQDAAKQPHRRLQLRAAGRQQGQRAEGPVQRLFVCHPGPLHPHAQRRALCGSIITT